MKQIKSSRQGWSVILAYVLAGCIVYFFLSWQVITEAASDGSSPEWANPTFKAIKQVSATTGAQSNPNLFDNLDCTLATYRLPASSTMGTGCFTETALGLLESDSGIMIFNGTDEGLPLSTFSPHQVLVPWPQAGALMALDTVSTGGSYISLYKSLLSILKDQRNLQLQLTGKQLTAPPDLQIVDKLGQRLVINAQSLAFSYSGSWLVAETLNGSFVRINLATLEVKPFASSFSTSGSPALLKSRLSVSSDGRFVAIYNQVDDSFKLYDLSNCGAVSVNLQPEGCVSYDYLPFIKSQIGGLQSIRHVRFVNDELLSFEAYTTSISSGGIYELAPKSSIDSLIDYLGTGDSYTSGEGAFDYLAGTDTPDNMCHLSLRSYPILLTNDLFTSRGGHSVACSGAVINDVVNKDDRYKGQVKNVMDFKHLNDQNPALLASIMTNFTSGYVAQQRFIRQYQPASVTVEIGGNDIGFGNILEQCVGPHVSLRRSDNDCFNTYEDRLEILQQIDKTQKRWVSAFKQIKSVAPNATVYAIGYPQIADGKGSCALNVHLSKSEIEFGTELINYINQTIEESAGQAGVIYVDISQALVGHRLCETASYNVAVNGLTAGKDGEVLGIGLLGKESYHPNALGHQLIELEILRQTRNLTLGLVGTPPPKELGKILVAPKTGREIANRMPADSLTSKVIKKGGLVSVKVNGNTYSLKPNTDYIVKLDGVSGSIIGSTLSDDSGNISYDIMLPINTKVGGHTISVIGENQVGETINLVQPIYVSNNSNDGDGDELSDFSDSCPLLINSGVDTDQDNIDDACDPIIDRTPQSPVVNSSTPTSTSNNSDPTTFEGGPLSGPPSVSTNPVNGTLDVQTTPIKTNNLVGSRISIQANTKTTSSIPNFGYETRNPTAIRAKDMLEQNRSDNSSNTAQTKPVRTVGPHINWLAWIIAAVLFWLLFIVIGVYVESFVDHRAAPA